MGNLIHFKDFETISEYETYINGSPILPNVSIVGDDIYFTDGEPPIPPVDYRSMPLTIEIISGSNTSIQLNKPYQDTSVLYYKLNNGEWTEVEDSYVEVPVNANDIIQLKGTDNYPGYSEHYTIVNGGDNSLKYNLYGNVMSILYNDNFSGQTEFLEDMYDGLNYLFYENPSIVSAENLILPLTTATTGCYKEMFAGCTSLTTAPELPATVLESSCYEGMFSGCTSLNYIKCLATDISATYCTEDWVSGVANSGTFVKNGNMEDWGSGVNGIPNGWTVEDAS